MSSYVTNAEADLYFESRFDSGLWNIALEAEKTQVLATASRYLSPLNWAGDKADADQVLEFPRGEDTDIPEDIKSAVCEIAYALLDGRNIEYEREMIGQTGVAALGSRLATDPDSVDVARLHGIPSVVAWHLLRPYLRDGSAVTLVRTY